MKYCWTTILVRDMKESMDFYQGLIGLELNRRFSPREGMDIAFLGKGETQVELIYNESAKESDMGNAISIAFETESLEEFMALLKETGIDIIGKPIQANPHIRYIFVRDPNGLKIQLVENK